MLSAGSGSIPVTLTNEGNDRGTCNCALGANGEVRPSRLDTGHPSLKQLHLAVLQNYGRVNGN